MDKKYNIEDITPEWLQKKFSLSHYKAKLVYKVLEEGEEFNDIEIAKAIFDVERVSGQERIC